MADITRCQNKLASFRIRELKEVLARLGLPKQGKKQILVDKIMGLILPMEKQPVGKGSKGSKKNVVTREEAINIIDEAYRLLRSSGTDSVAGGKHKSTISGSSSGHLSAGIEEAPVLDENKNRCPCGNSTDIGTMIQCDDQRCRIWQHMSCVVVPEKLMDGVQPEIPPYFYCELCRISHGDPFCSALSHPLLPTKLSSSTIQSDGSNTLQTIEKSFTMTRADQELLRKPDYDLQVWCVLLSDKVTFRMHWPLYTDLRVNGGNVRVMNRPGQQQLGANGREEGPGITAYIREGLNRLSMSAYDARPFCVGVRLIRRCSLQQVLDMIPNEKDGEPYEEALARVRRCIGGGQGMGVDDDDDDSDLEVVADSITVNLRCPMSGSRIKVAGRFKPCLHMGCFDLDTFVELNQRSRKWQCPICLKNYSIETLRVDPFFNRITNAVKSMAEDITEVELKADGSWRPKLEGDTRFQEPWRLSGSSVPPLVIQPKAVLALAPLPNSVKVEEGVYSQENGSLRLGKKRAAEGVWAANASNHMNGGPSYKKKRTLPNISKSSSATDSNIGGEDEQSVNQDPSEKVVELTEENDDITSRAKPVQIPEGLWQSGGGDPPNAGTVILLSDTDDEDGEDLVVGSSGGSVHGGSNTRDSSIAISPEAILNDRHDDSSGVALVPDAMDVTLAVRSPDLPFNTLASTRMVMEDMTDKATNNSSDLELQAELNSFWPGQPDNVPKGPYGYFESIADHGVSRYPPPVRPTPMQAVAGSGFLSSSVVSDESRPSSGWLKCRRPLTSVTYINNDCASTGNGRISSPTERQFMLPDPVRTEIQTSSREPLGTEDNIDNSWFSLSLGGGAEGVMENGSKPISSHERQALASQPETSASALLVPNSNGTSHVRPTALKAHGRSHISGGSFTIPSRPRSSPIHVRRPRRRFQVDDSDSEE